jgi:hypothetical protein
MIFVIRNIHTRSACLTDGPSKARFTALDAMVQGPAHELLYAETVGAAFEQFLNPRIERFRILPSVIGQGRTSGEASRPGFREGCNAKVGWLGTWRVAEWREEGSLC